MAEPSLVKRLSSINFSSTAQLLQIWLQKAILSKIDFKLLASIFNVVDHPKAISCVITVSSRELSAPNEKKTPLSSDNLRA